MEMIPNQTPADLNVKSKLKTKRKGRKREASDGCAVQGMNQKDRSIHDIESGEAGMTGACSYSQEKPMELDFTAKWSQESSKSSTVTTTADCLKKPLKSEKKRVKRGANDGCAVESIDLNNTNMYVTKNGKNGLIAEPCSPVKPVKLDSTAKLSQENPKSSDDTTANPLEKLSKSKRKSRRGNREATEGMNQKDKSMCDIENGKNGMTVKPCSPNKPMELDCTEKLCLENPKSGEDTLPNTLEKLSKSKRKRLKKARNKAAAKLKSESIDHKECGGDTLTDPLNNLSKSKRKKLRKAAKKAAAKLGPESMDQINIISNLSLANASDAYTGDNVNYGTELSQESRCSTGIGISDKVDMQHKSSIVISETQNNLLANPYQITQRRKLLILDVNGLLADVVFPVPQRCHPDTRTLGRASKNLNASCENFP